MRLRRAKKQKQTAVSAPTRGMPLVFRAELMPGRERVQRTFRLRQMLSSGRVELFDLEGQHNISEFEPWRREEE